MEISIYKAKSERQRLENDLEKAINRKNNILDKIDRLEPRPKAKNIDSVLVDGGTRSDKYASYVITKEEFAEELKQIDISIIYYQEEIQNIDNYILKELKRMNEYDEWEQKVIYMRESHCTWIKIACSVPFSEKTCRNIYRRYKNKRDV